MSRGLSLSTEKKVGYSEDEEFPVDEERWMSYYPLRIRCIFTIEDVKDYGQYGLMILFALSICQLRINPMKSCWVITARWMHSDMYLSDGNVYLVKDDPLNYHKAELKDLIDNDDPPKFKDVEEIHFAGAETYRIIYEEDSENTYRDEMFISHS